MSAGITHMHGTSPHTEQLTIKNQQKSNYELFNCNNFNIRYWSWNYRGCWPRRYRVLRLPCQFVICSTPMTRHSYEGISTFLKHTQSDPRGITCIHPHLTARYDGRSITSTRHEIISIILYSTYCTIKTSSYQVVLPT